VALRRSNLKLFNNKIRHLEHVLENIRFFPSYTQTGDSFNIEKRKRKMIAEDISKALDYIKKV